MDTIQIKVKKSIPEFEGKVLQLVRIEEGVYASVDSGKVVFDWGSILKNISVIRSWIL